ncbi:Uncharacterized protein SVXHr_2582 [Halorhabdus sp. SVX81]|uniref:hypothetical protein n=1 Tax=Halorhabdus sp. SVX81 TaxID=2978283 RepID=UPI0023DA5AF0|nr:hypothetical protein [Halorhabdus sp. SVX81]WEL18726.1 Uncharacterized protein SVXHr_2582 [Halorhabdus sp. SVX81]
MTSGKSWTRQKGEIDAYNAFLSAYRSRSSYHGFSQRGYRLTNFFPTIDNRFTDDAVEPDFSLYDGETLILAEVKQGNNIDVRDVEQTGRLDSVTLDAAEAYMDKMNIGERFGLSGDVYGVEPLIYYDGIDSTYIEKCRNEWESCEERLIEMESNCPILGREADRQLKLLTGQFNSADLTEWLEYGIKMSETPRVTVSMTDGLEIESVAVTICNIWGQRAVSEPVRITVSQLRNHFNYRSLEPGRVESAFRLLDDLGAGNQLEKRELEFTPEDMPEILDIETLVSERSSNSSEEDLDRFL